MCTPCVLFAIKFSTRTFENVYVYLYDLLLVMRRYRIRVVCCFIHFPQKRRFRRKFVSNENLSQNILEQNLVFRQKTPGKKRKRINLKKGNGMSTTTKDYSQQKLTRFLLYIRLLAA